MRYYFPELWRLRKAAKRPFIWVRSVNPLPPSASCSWLEQGKVDLNAPVSTYLPGATDGDRISVRQLLNHTSGLGQYQTLENYKIVNEQGVHHYANVNYSLLGEIIEAVSGESYSDYITKNLFEPLQLSHTAATQDESEKNGLIDGYTNYWGFNIKTSHKYPSSKDDWITVPAGYISSSTEDLGKYLQMYLNRGSGILSESQHRYDVLWGYHLCGWRHPLLVRVRVDAYRGSSF